MAATCSRPQPLSLVEESRCCPQSTYNASDLRSRGWARALFLALLPRGACLWHQGASCPGEGSLQHHDWQALLGGPAPGCPELSPGAACCLSGCCLNPARDKGGQARRPHLLLVSPLALSQAARTPCNAATHSLKFPQRRGAHADDLKSAFQCMDALVLQLCSRQSQHTEERAALQRTDATHLVTVPVASS